MSKFDPKAHIKKVTFTNKKTGEKRIAEILDTAPRLAWFLSDHPIEEGWVIKSETLRLDDNGAFYEVSIINPEGKTVANAHRLVLASDFHNYNEKAETQALGRALALLGYGTLQALEPGEGDNGEEEGLEGLPDSPQPARKVPAPSERPPKVTVATIEQEVNAQLEAMGLEPHYKGRIHTVKAIEASGHRSDVLYLAEHFSDVVNDLIERVKAKEEGAGVPE